MSLCHTCFINCSRNAINHVEDCRFYDPGPTNRKGDIMIRQCEICEHNTCSHAGKNETVECPIFCEPKPATVDVTIAVPVPPEGWEVIPDGSDGEMFFDPRYSRWVEKKIGDDFQIARYGIQARKLPPPEPTGLAWLETLTPGTTLYVDEDEYVYSWTGTRLEYLSEVLKRWAESANPLSYYSASTCTIIGDPATGKGGE